MFLFGDGKRLMEKRKPRVLFILCMVLAVFYMSGCAAEEKKEEQKADKTGKADMRETEETKPEVFERQAGDIAAPSTAGALHVEGTKLCGEDGSPVQLKGISTHGLAWFPGYVNEECFGQLRKEWKANVIRLAMYTAESGGYCTDGDREALKELIREGAAYAKKQDMYVIIDWHILSDSNPNQHIEEACAFFDEMSKEFAGRSNVLYEICNEPNGGITWQGNVKPYAQRVIAAIREHAPRGIILVGSPTWSQDIHLAAADPLQGENLMYTLHFYAGTHGAELRERIDAARKGGLPVFVSEWGTSRAGGGGGVFLEEAGVWLDFLEERAISWCNWSLCDKDEASAALRPGTAPGGTWSEADLTPSGRFVFSRLAH